MSIDRNKYPLLHPKLKILVVDDMESSRKVLKSIFNSLGFKKISTAASVEDALKIFNRSANKEDTFDLICSDIQMPGLTGLEFLKLIRENKITRTTPVLMVSSESDSDTILNAVDLGASNYVLKPYSESDIIEKLITIFYPNS